MRMAMSAMPLEESVRMSAWVLKSAGMDAGRQVSLCSCLALPKGGRAADPALRGRGR